ncbi:MarR family transcriptional regulator [Neobacillus sp. MM2021_6]|uniref:MarR family winged helix-turn-helix transcriptional regulator n=1 Tax=Bacillaceae TaxID=186817 RepID=UPI001407B2D2|nr:MULTISPECIES: MarR family transcriptional regulator [Bacillaceae]MBO0961874.1 MarR family transcriptional regulator [Neobacillus sp. MM2021_6]NHC18959.1 MarR family transcriptional regulator [Bacillus sp. MM2020_4]WML39216.1 MarR family transcriptional regulator [Neobacillus sp. OS1-2]
MNDEALETIELELAILIRRTTAVSTNKKLWNLDRSAYLLLRRIVTKGAVGVKTLAGEFGLDISTISRQTAALEHKGFLTRIPDPLDGRAYSFQITEQGTKELNDHKQARLERIAELLGDWPEEEREIFGQLLKKFNLAFRV